MVQQNKTVFVAYYVSKSVPKTLHSDTAPKQEWPGQAKMLNDLAQLPFFTGRQIQCYPRNLSAYQSPLFTESLESG